jgi:hypothetical protein
MSQRTITNSSRLSAILRAKPRSAHTPIEAHVVGDEVHLAAVKLLTMLESHESHDATHRNLKDALKKFLESSKPMPRPLMDTRNTLKGEKKRFEELCEEERRQERTGNDMMRMSLHSSS